MSSPTAPINPSAVRGVLAAVAAAFLSSACAGGSVDFAGLLGGQDAAIADGKARSRASQSDIDKAVEYWGNQHAKEPRNIKTALSYARNLKAAGRKEEAFQVMQNASLLHGDNKELASEYGRMALEMGQANVAHKVLALADDPAKPDWRVISARGTAFAKQGAYAEAIPFYERALSLAPDQPSVLNNLALAYAADGQAQKAEEIMRRAAAGSDDPKVRQNLALVLGLQGKHEEAKQIGSRHLSPEAASANADYVRQLVKATPAGGQSTIATAAAAKPQPAQSAAQPLPAGLRQGEATAATTSAGGWSTQVARVR